MDDNHLRPEERYEDKDAAGTEAADVTEEAVRPEGETASADAPDEPDRAPDREASESHGGETRRIEPVGRQYGAYYNNPYQNRAYGPYEAPNYETRFEQSAPPVKRRSGRRAVIVIGCVLVGVILLLAGSIAGTFAFYYYQEGEWPEFFEFWEGTNESALPGESEFSVPAAPLPGDPIPDDSKRIEIVTIPPDGGALGQPELSVEDIAEKVKPSVVGVITESLSSMAQSSTGSGIIMSEDGYVITNHHVIAGSDMISVVLDSGDSYTGKVIGSDEKTDLAVLKIDAQGLPAVEFGDSDALRVGTLAVAIGNPMGIQLQGTVTQGIISAINRDVIVENRVMSFLQTDASINPGNSGGPLVNKYGQVIGINTVKLGISYYEGLGFAIPMNTAKPIVDELIAFGYIRGRPAIGITGRGMSERFANYYGVPQGVLVESVLAGSDAAAQGLLPNDIITAVNGTRVVTMTQISMITDDFSAGDRITLTVHRVGKYSGAAETIDITFTLMDEAMINRNIPAS